MLKAALKMTLKKADQVFGVYSVYIYIIDIERNNRGDYETFEAFLMDTKQKIEGNINNFCLTVILKTICLTFFKRNIKILSMLH